MTAASEVLPDTAQPEASAGVWALAWRRLRRHRTGMAAAGVVLMFLAMILSSFSGLIARDWDAQIAVSFAPPAFLGLPASDATGAVGRQPDAHAPVEMYGVVDPLAGLLQRLQRGDAAGPALPTAVPGVDDPIAALMANARQAAAREGPARAQGGQARAATLWLGADKWGRSVALKVIKGAETSVLVGLASAALATLIGTLLGALAGYLGGAVDAVLDWLYGVFTAIPYLLLVFAVAAVLQQKGVVTIILILGLTGWTGVYRLVRAEYLRHKGREYVQAARAIGASHLRRMFVHILPNASHVILVQLSQSVVNFIKAEVILSFLGFGVPVDVVSWGSILNEAASELILGKWWQMAAAAIAMAVLVTAFAMLTDALRDALDPRLK